MPAPSQLHIATQVVQRLVKEEKSYHDELEGQKRRAEKLKADMASGENTDENAEYILKQEETAITQTKAVFGPLRKRIEDAVQKLELQIAASDESNGAAANEQEMTKAKETLAQGKAAAAAVVNGV